MFPLLVHHVRKRQALERVAVTLDRVRGSSVITQYCHSVIGLYRLEEWDQVGPVRMQIIKMNLGTPPPALGFTITDDGLEFGDAPEEGKPETKVDRAADLLSALLRRGPMLTDDLKREMDGAGISWETVKRAKDRLGVVARKERMAKGRWTWALPAKGSRTLL